MKGEVVLNREHSRSKEKSKGKSTDWGCKPRLSTKSLGEDTPMGERGKKAGLKPVASPGEKEGGHEVKQKEEEKNRTRT